MMAFYRFIVKDYHSGKRNQKWKAHPSPRLAVENSKRRDLQKEILPQWQLALKWGLGEVEPGCTPSSHTGGLPSPVLPGLTQSLPQVINQWFGCDSTVPIHMPTQNGWGWRGSSPGSVGGTAGRFGAQCRSFPQHIAVVLHWLVAHSSTSCAVEAGMLCAQREPMCCGRALLAQSCYRLCLVCLLCCSISTLNWHSSFCWCPCPA